MVRPHAQYSTVEPVFMQIPKDADRLLYSEDNQEKKIEKPANGSVNRRKDLVSKPEYDPRAIACAPIPSKNHRIAKGIKMNTKDVKTAGKSQAPLPKEHFSLSPLSLSSSDSDFNSNSNSDSRSKQKTYPSQKQTTVAPIKKNLKSKKANDIKLTVKNTITKAQEDGPTTSSSAPKRRINDSLNDEGVTKKKKANGRKDLTLEKAQSASNPDYDPRAIASAPKPSKNLRIAKGIKMNTKDANIPQKQQTSPFHAKKNRSLEVSQSAPFTGIAPEASSSAPKRKNTDPIHPIRPKWQRMEENPADMFSF